MKPRAPYLDEVLPLIQPDRHVRLRLSHEQKHATRDRDGFGMPAGGPPALIQRQASCAAVGERRGARRCSGRAALGYQGWQGSARVTGRFSKKAKRHAKQSRMGTKRMLAEAPQRSGPVEVYFECPICGGAHAKADHVDERASTSGKGNS